MDVSEGSPARTFLRRFLDATLRPLVAASASSTDRFRHIHAWEIINEPDWAIHAGRDRGVPFGDEFGNVLLHPEGMLALFEEAAVVIAERHFPISIGFANGAVPRIRTFRNWLSRQSWRGSYWRRGVSLRGA